MDELSQPSSSVQDEQSDLSPLLPTAAATRGASTSSSSSSSGSNQLARSDGKGLGVVSTSFFILTGVLFTIPLPYALLQTGLVSGIMLMTIMPAVMVYMAILIGRCWVIMMEKWPERYQNQRVRRPFPAIGREAGGRFWEITVWLSVNSTNFGVTVVDLLVAVETIKILLPGHFSDRVWLLFCTAVMMPFVWLGTPMESFIVGWVGGGLGLVASLALLMAVAVAGASSPLAAAASTTISTVVTTSTAATWNTTATAMTSAALTPFPVFPALTNAVTFRSFWIGMSTISFTYAGMSIFPTLQHDMKEPRKWAQSLLLSYVFISSFALATAVVGLVLFGSLTNANVLENVQCRSSSVGQVLATVCSVLYAIVSLCNGVVTILPVVQDSEDLLKLPAKTNYKHILLRTFLLLVCLAAAEAIPHFDQYISLIGATSISLNNFVFPPLFYYWLSKENGKTLGLAQKTFFGEMIVFGVISAIAGTYSSIENILSSSGPDPC